MRDAMVRFEEDMITYDREESFSRKSKRPSSTEAKKEGGVVLVSGTRQGTAPVPAPAPEPAALEDVALDLAPAAPAPAPAAPAPAPAAPVREGIQPTI